ncbi:MAG TPA: Dabb family protein [Terriglobia bacterium]|nr:Dabb family protein [Terriglobia bacterium]
MICHLVLYQMKPELNDDSQNQLVRLALEKLALLPGVKNLRAGKSIKGPEKGYSVALAMDFADEAALEVYRVHPDHQKFVKEIAGPMVSEILRFDFSWS